MCPPPRTLGGPAVHGTLERCVDRLGAAGPPRGRAGHCRYSFCSTLLLQPVQVLPLVVSQVVRRGPMFAWVCRVRACSVRAAGHAVAHGRPRSLAELSRGAMVGCVQAINRFLRCQDRCGLTRKDSSGSGGRNRDRCGLTCKDGPGSGRG